MSDQDRPLTFEQLPPRVRQDFDAIREKLGPALILGNFRATRNGWVASIFTLDGHNGGDYLVLAEPGEQPLRPPQNGQG
jgi:hypothetical protein